MLRIVESALHPRLDGTFTLLVSRRCLYDERYRLNAYRVLLEAELDGVL